MARTAGEMVKEFHEIFGHPVGEKPQLLTPDREALRLELIAEEYERELLPAVENMDIIGTIDALGDIVYVVYGMAWEMGVDLDEVVEEIHRSNMSKLDENGKAILREDGKVLKGTNYSPPDLESVIYK